MNKIDTTNWKEFNITDLFEITGSTTTPKNNLDLDNSSEYPYITTAATNNGVAGYSQKFTEYGDVLTIDSAVIGTCFYQKQNFTASDHVEKLIPKFKMNENIALFFSCILNKTALIYDYAYNQKRSQKALNAEKIKLPVTTTGEPDWQFMDDYMQNITARVGNKISRLESAKKARKNKIDVSRWQEFHLYDIFNIDSGTKLDKAKMNTTVEEIDFVGRSNANNGITSKVQEIDSITPYKRGDLTLALGGAYLGSCFVQPEDFYTSQNVVVLIPKQEISFYTKQFIATAIFKESQNNYKAFIKELNAHIKTDFSIKLPVTDTGEPDWQFMDNYMRAIESKQIKNFINFIN